MPLFPAPLEKKWLLTPRGWDDTWKAAQAAAAVTPARVLLLGESGLQGSGVCTDTANNSTAGLLRVALQNRLGNYSEFYSPVRSYDFHTASAGSAALTGPDPWTVDPTNTRTYDTGGFLCKDLRFSTASIVASPAVTFDSSLLPDHGAFTNFDVIYDDATAGTFTLTVDNGPAQTFTCTGGGGRGMRRAAYAGSALSNATHVIRITSWSGANVVRLQGFVLYNPGATGGLAYANCSYGGSSSAHYFVNSNSNFGWIAIQGAPAQTLTYVPSPSYFGFPSQPHLAIIQWGVQEMEAAVATSTFFSNLEGIIQACRYGVDQCSILLVQSHVANSSASTGGSMDGTGSIDTNAATYNGYLQQVEVLARLYNCAVLRMHAKWGGFAVRNGFESASGLGDHATDAGHVDQTSLLLSVI